MKIVSFWRNAMISSLSGIEYSKQILKVFSLLQESAEIILAGKRDLCLETEKQDIEPCDDVSS
jgi:hypothetical protein